MVYIRPSHIPYPEVWSRFSVKRGSATIRLRVQDLTEDMHETAVQMLKTYFTRDEPPCRYIEISREVAGNRAMLTEINKHPKAVSELEKLWRTTISDRLSIACVEDKDDGEMVGVNVLTVVRKGDKEEPFHTEDKTWAILFGAVDLVGRGADVFSHYSVDQYLTAYGLVIPPEWRGLGIGQEILRARIPLCKALNVQATATVFTAAASQAVARKAGFEDLFEMSYDDLAKRGFVFPGIEENTKSSKLMGLAIK